MTTKELQSIVDDFTPMLREFALAEYGLAIGGSYAKGTADEKSDLDLYVFAQSVMRSESKDGSERGEGRSECVRRYFPEVENLISWGNTESFTQAGTDFIYKGLPIECWLRNSELIDQIIADCQAGIVKRELVTWTPTGFYNHCALSDLNTMIIVDDPAGIIANWKNSVATYPPKLQEAIIKSHLRQARFWPANFHYTSAVERADIIYTTAIVQQVVHNLIQVLFAVNQVYFPGDKKLTRALEGLEKLPASFIERMHYLIDPECKFSVTVLKKQQIEIQKLVKDTGNLAELEI